PRHLLQIVAVKRRQAAGLTIAEIQVELAGAPDSVLQTIVEPEVGPATAARPRFWTAPAAQAASPTGDFGFSPDFEVTADARERVPDAFAVQGLRLADGVTLLVEGAPFTTEGLTALAASAQPLLAEIARRRADSRRSS
ncbi:MAG: hypothetical protein ABIQ26_06325, partial [Streptosporangiaceae bacterium]